MWLIVEVPPKFIIKAEEEKGCLKFREKNFI